MVSLIEHVERLVKHCVNTKEEILESILNNEYIMDEDSLLCYSIDKTCSGNYMMIMWESGDGDKMWQWIQDLSREHQCKKIYFISQRWKPLCRKYKFRPVGVLCEREGFM